MKYRIAKKKIKENAQVLAWINSSHQWTEAYVNAMFHGETIPGVYTNGIRLYFWGYSETQLLKEANRCGILKRHIENYRRQLNITNLKVCRN